MELRVEEKELIKRPSSSPYSPSFQNSSETLDHHHHHHHHHHPHHNHASQQPQDYPNQPPQSSLPHPKRPEPDQIFGSGGDRIEPKPAGSSLNFKPIPKSPASIYRECLKNHAAAVGGNVLDGCGEFMPAGEEGSLEALKCAACNCHRNFHRRELSGSVSGEFGGTVIHHLQLPSPFPKHHSKPPIAIHANNHWTPMVQPVKMAFGGSVATESSSEDLNFNGHQSNAVVAVAAPPAGMSKKRFRTKFTAEQKEKMMEFAEKVGWRIPREDDVEVQRFCAEVNVRRQVFKVWMHNNKSTVKQQQQQQHQHQHQES